MKKRIIEFRRSLVDISNPYYDRRHRYGDQSVREIPAGSAFLAAVGDGLDETYIQYLRDGRVKLVPYGMKVGLLAHSEPATPATVKEAILSVDGISDSEDMILQALVERGVVTLEQVMEIASEQARSYEDDEGGDDEA